jgi:hypothetical protein
MCVYSAMDGLRTAVLADGGDGRGYLVTPEWRLAAHEFRRLEQLRARPWFTTVEETDSAVLFIRGQEWVVFQATAPSHAGAIIYEWP